MLPELDFRRSFLSSGGQGAIHALFVVRGGEDFSHLMYSRFDAARRSFAPAVQLAWPQPIAGRLTGAWLIPCSGGGALATRCGLNGAADILLEIVHGRTDYPSRAASTAGFGAAAEDPAAACAGGGARCHNPKWTIQGQWDALAPTASLFHVVSLLPSSSEPGQWAGGGKPVLIEQPKLVSPPQGATPYTFASVTALADVAEASAAGGPQDGGSRFGVMTLVTGSLLGEMEVHRLVRGGNKGNQALLLVPVGFVSEADGTTARHATIRPTPVAFGRVGGGAADGCGGGSAASGAPCHLLIGGEGALFWRLRAHPPPSASAALGPAVFEPPLLAEEKGAPLFGGSLPVPSLGDIDGDGLPDLLVGNSEGRLLWFSSRDSAAKAAAAAPASAAAPLSFRGMPRSLPLAGEPFLTQPLRPMQGPAETRYGHTQPQLVDWDGDGVLDLLLSDADGHLTVSMGALANASSTFGGGEEAGGFGGALARGDAAEQGQEPLRGAWWALGGNDFASAARPPAHLAADPAAVRFGPRRTLLLRGNPLWGPWRVRPAAARAGRDGVVIVTLDRRNRLHAFSGGTRGVHLKDEGVLRSADGTGAVLLAQIGSAEAAAGDWGRATLSLVDFDLDGVLDLIIGTGTTRGAPPPKGSTAAAGGGDGGGGGGADAGLEEDDRESAGQAEDDSEPDLASGGGVGGAFGPGEASPGGAGGTRGRVARGTAAATAAFSARRQQGRPGFKSREVALPHVTTASVLFLRGAAAAPGGGGGGGKQQPGAAATAGAAPAASGQWASRFHFHLAEPLFHDGKQLDFGRHKCSPEPVPAEGAAAGFTGGPHLLVGEEGGRFVFLHRDRLSAASYPDGFPAADAATRGRQEPAAV